MTNDEFINNEGMINNPKTQIFDLEKRTTAFGKAIVNFAKKIKETTITRPLISQIVRSGTSVGANYCEADDTNTRKDFAHKISFCRKEARETKYWLNIIADAAPELNSEIKVLWNKARELNLIFASIVNKVKKNLSN